MRVNVTAHRGNFNFHLSFSKVLHQNHQCLTLIVCIYIIPVGMHSIFWLCCVQAVMFWKHSVWYTCAVSICKLINGSQFPVLVFLMLCQRKLNRPDVHHLWTICIDWRIMFSNYFQPFSLQVNRLVYRINFQEYIEIMFKLVLNIICLRINLQYIQKRQKVWRLSYHSK